MTASTLFKSLLKIALVILFLTERSFYYQQMSVQPSDIFHLHHEILPGFDVDYKRVDNLYEKHQLFNLPFVKWSVEKVKEFVEHHSNLNQTLEHQKHSHIQNLLRTFKNKLVDLDIKFEFFFITAYDLLILTFLIVFIISDSVIFNFFLIADSLLKFLQLSIEIFKTTKFPMVYDKFIKLIQDFLGRDFLDAWKIISTFFNKEKLLIINLAIIAILTVLFIYLITEKFSKGLSLDQVADIAHDFKEKIEEKIHDIGVGISKGMHKITSPLRERNSPENTHNLKTMESEGVNSENLNSSPKETQFMKKEVQPQKKERVPTPSKRRAQKSTL